MRIGRSTNWRRGKPCQPKRNERALPRWLLNGQHLIGGDGFQLLHDSAWPRDLNKVCFLRHSQPEVCALVAGRNVASCGAHECSLLMPIFGHKADLRSNAVAVAGGTEEIQRKPVVSLVA